MGEIAVSDRQITLFYSSKSSRAKQTLAYAKAEGLPIQEIDILKTKLNQICRLAITKPIFDGLQKLLKNRYINLKKYQV